MTTPDSKPTRKFINLSNVSKHLYCSICSDIFTEPVRLPCGHTYCKECIKLWAKKHLECPICRVAFKENQFQRDLVGYNMVNELEVYCNNKFMGRGENPDDLFQVGCIGLIKAIDNFDPNLDVRFSTYGVPMIIGEIRRFLRDSNPVRVSRSMRDTAYRAMQIKEAFINEHGREPKIEEIAKEMGVPKSRVVVALEAIIEPVSLYDPVYSDSGDTIYMMDQISDKSSDSSWLEEISLKEDNAYYVRFKSNKKIS